jgi:hypothetical protein
MYPDDNAGRYDNVHGDEDDGYEFDDRDWDMVDLGECDD